ncbi:MAG: hypothetical protein CL800_01040 [Citromicrobium sp.]|nr:hypothetical protein [Citromicrobium sp.]
MLLLGRMTAEQKLASFLLEMADRLGTSEADGSTTVLLPLSRQQIADILGLTVETVSRQLTQLRAKGIITLSSRREIRIDMIEELQTIAG